MNHEYHFGVLQEELQRLQQLADKYRQEIQDLPKGSIQKKVRDGHGYVYLAYRERDKVMSQYIGTDRSPEVTELLQKVLRRKNYEQKLKQVTKDLQEVQKALHGKSRKTLHRGLASLT